MVCPRGQDWTNTFSLNDVNDGIECTQHEFPEGIKVEMLFRSDHCTAIQRDLNMQKGISQTSAKENVKHSSRVLQKKT